MEIVLFVKEDGHCPFEQWIEGLRDSATRGRIYARINRVRLGNLGDAKPLGDGLWELRLDFGPGYRVYFGRRGREIVVLLAAATNPRSEKTSRWRARTGECSRNNSMNEPKHSKPYETHLHERLRAPAEAAAYLNAALEDSDYRVFLMAVRDVATANGGIGRVATETGLNRENLYRMLSENGNPRINSLGMVLADLGLRLSVSVAAGGRTRRSSRPGKT